VRHGGCYGILPSSWNMSGTGETGGKSATREDNTSDQSRLSRRSRESRENNEIRITGGESYMGELGGMENGLV
jgi:hypothetical protein